MIGVERPLYENLVASGFLLHAQIKNLPGKIRKDTSHTPSMQYMAPSCPQKYVLFSAEFA